MGSRVKHPKTPGKATDGIRVSQISIKTTQKNNEQWIVRNIDFNVARGEFVALVGPSGCGKSTIMNAIAGLSTPKCGSVIIDGHNNGKLLGKIAYMHQRDLLLPWRTTLENARLGLEIQKIKTSVANQRAKDLAVKFGLKDALMKYPWQLSGGMRQRVALLRTYLPDSSVLLLDEPFGALDAITRYELQIWLSKVLKGTMRSVLLVTHDVEEALFLADRVIVMGRDPGHIITVLKVGFSRKHHEIMTTTKEFMTLKAKILALLKQNTKISDL